MQSDTCAKLEREASALKNEEKKTTTQTTLERTVYAVASQTKNLKELETLEWDRIKTINNVEYFYDTIIFGYDDEDEEWFFDISFSTFRPLLPFGSRGKIPEEAISKLDSDIQKYIDYHNVDTMSNMEVYEALDGELFHLRNDKTSIGVKFENRVIFLTLDINSREFGIKNQEFLELCDTPEKHLFVKINSAREAVEILKNNWDKPDYLSGWMLIYPKVSPQLYNFCSIPTLGMKNNNGQLFNFDDVDHWIIELEKIRLFVNQYIACWNPSMISKIPLINK